MTRYLRRTRLRPPSKSYVETGRGGASRIRAEHIKGWLAAARRGGVAEEKGKAKTATEEEGEGLWGKVVELTQTAFWDDNLAEEATWQTVVLIPKGKGEFR